MHTINALSLIKALGPNSARAYVPDAKEQCEIDASAICEVNGMQSLVTGPCPNNSKTIRAAKNIDCSVTQPQPPPKVAVTQQAQTYSRSAHTNDFYSWLPFVTIFTLLALFAALALRVQSRSSGKSKLKIAIRWATITAASVAGGIVGARVIFYQTYEHIQNKEGYFATLAAMAAGLFGFVLIGMCIGLLAKKVWKH